MLIIFVSNLGSLSVISYFMMKITIERLIEMYMMYLAMSSHIKTATINSLQKFTLKGIYMYVGGD
jgi:hypothetical protein